VKLVPSFRETVTNGSSDPKQKLSLDKTRPSQQSLEAAQVSVPGLSTGTSRKWPELAEIKAQI